MRTDTYSLHTLSITPLNDPMQGISAPVMQFLDILPIHARPNRRDVLVVVALKQRFQDARRGRRGVVEPCRAVPLAEAILAADLVCFRVRGRDGEGLDGGIERLDAAVEWRGVEALDWWRERLQMRGQLFRLLDAVPG